MRWFFFNNFGKHLWAWIVSLILSLLLLSIFGGCSNKRFLLSLAHKNNFPVFQRLGSTHCPAWQYTPAAHSASSVQTGAAAFRVALPEQQKLGGYGLFPFVPVLGRKIRKNAEAANSAWLQGSVSFFGNEGFGWFLVSIDAIGVPALIASEISHAISAAFAEVQADSAKVVGKESESSAIGKDCFLSTIVASHTHSGADIVGLWGAAASSLSAEINSRELRANLLEPLKKSIANAAMQAFLNKKDSTAFVKRSAIETNLQKNPGWAKENLTVIYAKPLQEGAQGKESLGDKDKTNVKVVLWVLDAHATTDPESTDTVSGDFPEFVRSAQKERDGIESTPFVFLAGAIAGAYPPEKGEWKHELALKLEQLVQNTAQQSWQVYRMVSQKYCVEVTSRLFSVFESWAVQWGGVDSEACEIERDHGIRGILVTLQRIDFKMVGADNHGMSLVFSPFEVFLDVENLLKTRFEANIQSVSLANGFLGHGLSQRQFCELTAEGITGAELSKKCLGPVMATEDFQRARPYHSLLSPFSEVESLLNDFLTN